MNAERMAVSAPLTVFIAQLGLAPSHISPHRSPMTLSMANPIFFMSMPACWYTRATADETLAAIAQPQITDSSPIKHLM